MTQSLRDSLYGGKFTKKTIFVPGDPAETYCVGKSYHLEGKGRAKLVSIQTDDNQTITDPTIAVPATKVRLFTARLANGKIISASPENRPPAAGQSEPRRQPSPPVLVILAKKKGVWLRQRYDVKKESGAERAS
jgi:hypothetical protein